MYIPFKRFSFRLEAKFQRAIFAVNLLDSNATPTFGDVIMSVRLVLVANMMLVMKARSVERRFISENNLLLPARYSAMTLDGIVFNFDLMNI